MTTFGMFTNEGNIALAEKLNQALSEMPTGLTADEQYARFRELCESDHEFATQHAEWSDTAVREIVYSWLDAPEAMTVTEQEASIDLSATLFLRVPTLDGDACAALGAHHDEISELLSEAIQEAMSAIERRIGVSFTEWSGVATRLR